MTAGFLVVHKPHGITSHDVVAVVRAVTGIKKVGHTGTLDPFATGVLPLALGPCTRLIEYLHEEIKVYDATIKLGEATDTGDYTGAVVDTQVVPAFSDEALSQVVSGMLGEQMQVPPMYSAIKVRGKALYKYAREGKPVEVPARKIHVYGLEVIERAGSRLRVLLTCSRGTYARVIADDLAKALGTRGHLVALERPRSGPFELAGALTFDTLAGLVAPESGRSWQDVLMARKKREDRVPWRPRSEVLEALASYLVPPVTALGHMPLIDVPAPVARRIRSGSVPRLPTPGMSVGQRFLAVQGGDLVAVMELQEAGVRCLKAVPER